MWLRLLPTALSFTRYSTAWVFSDRIWSEGCKIKMMVMSVALQTAVVLGLASTTNVVRAVVLLRVGEVQSISRLVGR